MRYIDLELIPERGWFHEMDQLIAAEPEITREAIHQSHLLNDGTVTMLYELAGPTEKVRALMDRYEKNIAYQTSPLDENTLTYTHYEPSTLIRDLLSIPQEYGIILEVPMVFTERGGIDVTVVGSEVAIQDAIAAIPEEVEPVVERTGEYHPTTERLFAELTERQQEILRVAIDAGYYEEPREVTYQDIAAEVDCTATTVGEHLRKIEARVLKEIVP